MDQIAKLLLLHEGFRRFPYRDSLGIVTIGIGRNLVTQGVSKSEAIYLLEQDILRARGQFQSAFREFAQIDEVRQAVLIDMAVNLGVRGLLGFRNTLRMVRAGQYTEAAGEMLKSRWATQVGARARRLAHMMESGEWPAELATIEEL